MNRILFLVLFIVINVSCAHRIVRHGYDIDKSDYRNCDIKITRFERSFDSTLKVGEVKLGESGFATACSEKHALEIMKNEACALDANIINIIEENRSDFWKYSR